MTAHWGEVRVKYDKFVESVLPVKGPGVPS